MADESKIKLVYKPEGATPREWVISTEKPAWDLQFNTEKATGWPWAEFCARMANGSAIAMQALVWTLRKRDEPRLQLESVEVPLESVDLQDIEDPTPAVASEETESGEA